MEAKRNTISNGCCCGGCNDDHDHDGLRLPGFRFHPTDEELVGFYLKRKVEKRSLRGIDMIIKHMDIYKHDPWDLTNEGSNSSSVGDNNNNNKEWYFYCKRGRKYRNSIRPNRVTGSGFWKATGIDKPIYSSSSSSNNNNNNNNNANQQGNCIGLKKSLVYYRGSAGKGTKTDWMMHEFRLPNHYQHHYEPYLSNNNHSIEIAQEEAEIWTLCRIFKRNKKQNPDWRELSSKKNAMKPSSRTSSIDSNTNYYQHYITFTPTNNDHTNDMIHTIISDDNMVTKAQNINNVIMGHQKNSHFQVDQNQQQWSFVARTPPSYSSSLNLVSENENDLQSLAYYGQNSWDDLNSVVEFAVNTPLIM